MTLFISRRAVFGLAALAVLGAAAVLTDTSSAAGKAAFYESGGAGASGYDVVAYFTEGRPVEGADAHTAEHGGTTWRFASAENRDLFVADPEAYLPQYGGYCAWAVSEGYTASTVPEAWRIVDGKLYLNYSSSVQERWEADIPGHIASADANWPTVLD